MSEIGHDIPETQPEPARPGMARNVLAGILGAALVIWLLSGIYQVPAGQVAVVQRLGEFIGESEGKVRTVGYGLHYHLPWPIDQVTLISTQQTYSLKVDAFNSSPQEYADFKRTLIREGRNPDLINALLDPYVVTGDKNIARVEINVTFQIDDPVAWLKSVSHEQARDYDPTSTDDMRNGMFQQIAQRVIVAQVAKTTLDQLILSGKEELRRRLEAAFHDGVQLGSPSGASGVTSMGISIGSVSITAAAVPDRVKGAYSNLLTQSQNARAAVVRAKADADAIVQKAESEKQTLIASAQVYRQSTVDAAQGEADRFQPLLEQYANGPTLMRINLWIDAAKAVYGSAKRIYFVRPGQPTTIIVDPPTFDPNQPTRPGQP